MVVVIEEMGQVALIWKNVFVLKCKEIKVKHTIIIYKDWWNVLLHNKLSVAHFTYITFH